MRRKYFSRILDSYRPVSAEELEQVFEQSADFFFSEWEKNFRTPAVAERIRFMGRCLSVNLTENHIAQVADYFSALIFEVPPRGIPGIKKQIPVLAERFPLAMISDTGYITGRCIRLFLAEEKLLHYFHSFVFSDEQPHSKPHRSVFEKTAQNLNVPLPQLIHIGDLERTDVSGARQAGCFCIKYTGSNRPGDREPTQAHYVVDDYRNLQEVLNRLVTAIGRTGNK